MFAPLIISSRYFQSWLVYRWTILKLKLIEHRCNNVTIRLLSLLEPYNRKYQECIHLSQSLQETACCIPLRQSLLSFHDLAYSLGVRRCALANKKPRSSCRRKGFCGYFLRQPGFPLMRTHRFCVTGLPRFCYYRKNNLVLYLILLILPDYYDYIARMLSLLRCYESCRIIHVRKFWNAHAPASRMTCTMFLPLCLAI